MNPKVDFFFEKEKKWYEEVKKLRVIALNCGLNEQLKWGNPCYTLNANPGDKQESNIVLIHVFKEYCALLFFKGALLDNTHGLLIQQTENVQAARQIRFKNITEIIAVEPQVVGCIHEAIAVEKAGLKVELKETRDFAICEEFQQRLSTMPDLKTAFEALTPGRQRAYLLHFAAPAQAKTRMARIEKYIPQIFDGKGLND